MRGRRELEAARGELEAAGGELEAARGELEAAGGELEAAGGGERRGPQHTREGVCAPRHRREASIIWTPRALQLSVRRGTDWCEASVQKYCDT